MDSPCTFCGGAAHPATGCVYGPRTIACRRCTEECWRWVKGHTNRKGKRNGPSFYEAAGKRAGRSDLVIVADCESVSGEFDPRRPDYAT